MEELLITPGLPDSQVSAVVVSGENSTKEHIELLSRIIMYIGCKRITETDAANHDVMIAYTSQLMHVVAVALCDNPMIERSRFFSAGSLRDCTRVAVINAEMWSELFCENKDSLVSRISEMQDSLEKIKQAVANEDRSELEDIMKHATSQKLKWLME